MSFFPVAPGAPLWLFGGSSVVSPAILCGLILGPAGAKPCCLRCCGAARWAAVRRSLRAVGHPRVDLSARCRAARSDLLTRREGPLRASNFPRAVGRSLTRSSQGVRCFYEDFLPAGVLTLQRPQGSGHGPQGALQHAQVLARPRPQGALPQAQVFPGHPLDSHYREARRARARGLRTIVGTSSFGRVAPVPALPRRLGGAVAVSRWCGVWRCLCACVLCGGRCSLSRLVLSTAPSLSVSCHVLAGPVSVRSQRSLD